MKTSVYAKALMATVVVILSSSTQAEAQAAFDEDEAVDAYLTAFWHLKTDPHFMDTIHAATVVLDSEWVGTEGRMLGKQTANVERVQAISSRLARILELPLKRVQDSQCDVPQHHALCTQQVAILLHDLRRLSEDNAEVWAGFLAYSETELRYGTSELLRLERINNEWRVTEVLDRIHAN